MLAETNDSGIARQAGRDSDDAALARLHPLARALVGLTPSLNTPFRADGDVDLAAVARLVERTVAAGASGALVLAVAGEGPYLSETERGAVSETIAEMAAGRLPIVVSVTATDLESSLRLARGAVEVGLTSICWQPPAGADLEALLAQLGRFERAGVELVMVQDLAWGGPGLPLETIVVLHERAPVFGSIKIETAPAGPKYSAVLEALDGRLHVAGGWAASQLLDALERGVHSFMPTAMDDLYFSVISAFRSGDRDGAQDIFETMLPILAFANQHIDISIRFFKKLRRLQGLFDTELCRIETALDPVQERSAEALVRRAIDLDAAAARRNGEARQARRQAGTPWTR